MKTTITKTVSTIKKINIQVEQVDFKITQFPKNKKYGKKGNPTRNFKLLLDMFVAYNEELYRLRSELVALIKNGGK